MKPELKFWRGAEADLVPSNIDLFFGLFFFQTLSGTQLYHKQTTT